MQQELPTTVNVSCVDGFHCSECNYILLSLVRSNPTGKHGFALGRNRLNVALSRARRGLVIVGSVATVANGGSA